MNLISRVSLLACLLTLVPSPRASRAQEAPAPTGLTEFTSKEGAFKALLPGKPAYEKVEVGQAKEIQHQYAAGGPSGAYLISYQDNPNLEGATAEKLKEALALGRDSLAKGFGGKVIETEDIELDETHPGLAFRATIPGPGGEARCRFYMVGTRLYQVIAIGMPAFVASDEATKVLDSFALVDEE